MFARTVSCHLKPRSRRVLEGTVQVQTYEVCNSTFHKIAARAA
jgi:hypothetical protein